jgi:hypothetical protein
MEVLLDSRRRVGGDASNPKLVFPQTLKFTRVRLNYASFYNTWDNVVPLNFTINATPITVPGGVYDINTLASSLQTAAQGVNPAYTVAVNGALLVWNVGTFATTDSATATILGVSTGTAAFTSVPDLTSPQAVTIRCDEIHRKASLQTDFTYSDSVLFSVPIFAPNYSQNLYMPPYSDFIPVLDCRLDSLTLRLSDQSGNALRGKQSDFILSLTVE